MATSTISASTAETAGITFAGAAAGAYFVGGDPILSAFGVGIIAALGVLGYHVASNNVKVSA